VEGLTPSIRGGGAREDPRREGGKEGGRERGRDPVSAL